jgi:hypothetical protein
MLDWRGNEAVENAAEVIGPANLDTGKQRFL